MNNTAVASPYQIYPKRYYDASPTWFEWNKLTAADVHALRTEHGFQGQNIYFYLNHPIQYVRLVGVVVEIELVGYDKYLILTIDDGSGACIAVKIVRRRVAQDDTAEYPSNTTIDNVDVDVSIGPLNVRVDNKPIDLGSVLKIKGTISTFRDTRQIELKRISVVADTNEEVKAWAETARWKRNILSKPWVLSQMQRDTADAQIRQEEQEERNRTKHKRERSAKYLEKKRRHDEKYETKRKALELSYNAGALKGSNVLPTPW